MALTKIKRKVTDPSDAVRVRDETGKEWLTRVEFRDATPIGTPGPDNTNMVIFVDAEDGKGPMSHSRVLTDHELANPDFDPETVVGDITTDLITKKKNINANTDKLKAFRDRVKNDDTINLKVTPAPKDNKTV